MNPWLIFVIGAACSGKSSFIKTIKTDEYTCLDDAKPLYKFFKADVLLSSGSDEFRPFVLENNIESFYLDNKPHSYAVPSGGYRITNPAVWDYVLQLTAKEISKGNKYILEFSRGIDPEYVKAFNVQQSGDIYKRSIGHIIKNVPAEFIDNSMIINMFANFENRVKRNYKRRENGGHFVNKNSMETIYKTDIFSFDHLDKNTGLFDVMGAKIPVCSFENVESKDIKQTELQFLQNYQYALDFYKRINNGR